jgi:hypothetical protein
MRRSPNSSPKVSLVCKSLTTGDQHLLADAPAYALHRLRKAELIRLWKVAGMWVGDDETIDSTGDDEDDAGLGKKELVDGLIAAVGQM